MSRVGRCVSVIVLLSVLMSLDSLLHHLGATASNARHVNECLVSVRRHKQIDAERSEKGRDIRVDQVLDVDWCG